MPRSTAALRGSARSRGLARLALVVLLFAVTLMVLLTTRIGVFLVFDVFGDLRGTDNVEVDPALGPIVLDAVLQPSEVRPLPRAIEQVSDIVCSAEASEVVLVTDQAELFALDPSLTEIVSQQVMLRVPRLLRQGALEGLDQVGSGRFVVVGEIGQIVEWQAQGREWVRGRSIDLSPPLQAREYTGVAADLDSDVFFLVDGDSQAIDVVDGQGDLMRRVAVVVPEDRLRPGRSVTEWLFSGVALLGDRLVVLTENYTTLLVVDPETGLVLRSFGLVTSHEASGLALCREPEKLGKRRVGVLVTLDHNLFDPRPPVLAFELPLAPGPVY